VIVTGNTVIDAFVEIANRPFDAQGTPLEGLPLGDGRLVVLTAHRRESLGPPLREALEAARTLVERYDDVHIVYPVHPNPEVRAVAFDVLADVDRVHLVAPLDYRSFVWLLSQAHLVLTDSGGIQEEAPSAGVPVLVLRDMTERPEAVEAGTARLVGTTAAKIVSAASRLLDDTSAYDAMARASNPYGDGRARIRIADAIEHRS
jgi:UDP-N-acetylglucosamine 2-epimerase